MEKAMRKTVLSTLFALTSIVPAVALGTSIPTTSAGYDIILSDGSFSPVIDTNIVNTDSGTSSTSNSDTTSTCITNACSGGAGSGTAFADFGTLRAGATGSVFGSVTGPVAGGFGGLYDVDAQVQYVDYVTVESNSLPDGTVVQATVYLALHALTGVAVSGGYEGAAVANVDTTLNFNGGTLHLCTLDDPFQQTINSGHCVANTVDLLEVSTIGDFVIGQQYVFQSILTATTFGNTASAFNDQLFVGQSGTSSAFADATHTSNTFLSPLGDFFFSSASGHDYALPDTNGVPEPGTLALLSIGAIGAGLFRRRREIANGAVGTFASTVNGITQTKSSTREAFRAPGTVCQ
jgi:hypothetical protein